MIDCLIQDNVFSIDEESITSINCVIEGLVSEIMRLRQAENYKAQPIFESRLNNKLKSFMRRFSEGQLGNSGNNIISTSLNPLISTSKLQMRNLSKDTAKTNENVPVKNCRSLEVSQKHFGGDAKIIQNGSFLNTEIKKTKTFLVHTKPTDESTSNPNRQVLSKNKKTLTGVSMIPKISQVKPAAQRVILNKTQNSAGKKNADQPSSFGNDITPEKFENHIVLFSPGKLDSDNDEIENDDGQLNWTDMFGCKNSANSAKEGSTCAYSDYSVKSSSSQVYYVEDTIIEDPEEDTL